MSATTKIKECPFCLTEYAVQDECPKCQPDPMPESHIDYLLACEELYSGDLSFRFDRTGPDTISIHCIGYEHAILHKIEEVLIKRYRLYYDFDRSRANGGFGLHRWDKVCARTFVYLKEPK